MVGTDGRDLGGNHCWRPGPKQLHPESRLLALIQSPALNKEQLQPRREKAAKLRTIRGQLWLNCALWLLKSLTWLLTSARKILTSFKDSTNLGQEHS